MGSWLCCSPSSKTGYVDTLLRLLNRADEQPHGDFAVVGQLGVQLPGLKVSGMGTVGLPLRPDQAAQLLHQHQQQHQQGGVGTGEAPNSTTSPVSPSSPRVSGEFCRSSKGRTVLPASAFEITNPAWNKAVQQAVQVAKDALGVRSNLVNAGLTGLVVCEPGEKPGLLVETRLSSVAEKGIVRATPDDLSTLSHGFSNGLLIGAGADGVPDCSPFVAPGSAVADRPAVRQADGVPARSAAFGTMLVQLPSDFQGGQLTVRNGNASRSIDFASGRPDLCVHTLVLYGSPSAIEVKKPLTTGVRLLLVYELSVPVGAPFPAPPRMADVEELDATVRKWERDAHAPHRLFYGLSPKALVSSLGIKVLNGHDWAACQLVGTLVTRGLLDATLVRLERREWSLCSQGVIAGASPIRQRYDHQEVKAEACRPLMGAAAAGSPLGPHRLELPGLDAEELNVLQDMQFEVILCGGATNADGAATIERISEANALVFWPRSRVPEEDLSQASSNNRTTPISVVGMGIAGVGLGSSMQYGSMDSIPSMPSEELPPQTRRWSDVEYVGGGWGI